MKKNILIVSMLGLSLTVLTAQAIRKDSIELANQQNDTVYQRQVADFVKTLPKDKQAEYKQLKTAVDNSSLITAMNTLTKESRRVCWHSKSDYCSSLLQQLSAIGKIYRDQVEGALINFQIAHNFPTPPPTEG